MKLRTSGAEKKPDTLVVNGSECEPYLTCDDRVMIEDAQAVMDGIALAMKATGVSRALIGIADNKPEAIRSMEAAAKEGIQVVTLPTRYPQGYEKMLIYALTGRSVPKGGLPCDVQCVVLNVATCAALSAAVREGRPRCV